MTFSHDTHPALYNACPVFEAVLPHLCRAYGRGAEADARRTAALRPLVQALRNSRSDTAGLARRGFAMADLARTWAARALDAAWRPQHAAALRACEPIVDFGTAHRARASEEDAFQAAWDEPTSESLAAAQQAAWEASATMEDTQGGWRRKAAAHGALAGGWAAWAAVWAARAAAMSTAALDLCVSDLLALVQRETARDERLLGQTVVYRGMRYTFRD